MDIDGVRKLIDRQRKKAQLMVGRCVLSSSEDKGLLTSQVEALEGETLEGVERLENYGLAGSPPAGSEGALLCVGGSRDHPLMVGLEHRAHRPELAEGEVKLYSIFKQMIHLDADGNIRIKAPKGVIIEAETFEAVLGKTFKVVAPEGAEIDGDLTGTKDVSDKKSSIQGMRDIYNSHTHPDTDPVIEKM